MRTSIFKKQIKEKLLVLTAFFALGIGLSSCTEEEVTENGILGTYIGGSVEEEHIIITIGQNNSGYTLRCEYENWENVRSSTATEKYEWKGTFQNLPSDDVKDSQGNKIGTVSFNQYSEKTKVTFTAKTKRQGTYIAEKGEEIVEW